MSGIGTLSEAFASFDVKSANPRWSWSARSDDGKTVVLALWQDEFEFVKDEKSLVYNAAAPEDFAESINRPGNRERLENLKWAQAQCDGLFHVVIIQAKDVKAEIKEIAECFPRPDILMKIMELNETTGAFRAVSVRQ